VLAATAAALALWVAAPESAAVQWFELAAGLALAMRLARWRGPATLCEPLLWVLHLGYGWLALGFLLMAREALIPLLPETTALHALTVGAIGMITLAVMTRASLGHTGRALTAGPGTIAIYALITLAVLRRRSVGQTICQFLALPERHGAAPSACSCCSMGGRCRCLVSETRAQRRSERQISPGRAAPRPPQRDPSRP